MKSAISIMVILFLVMPSAVFPEDAAPTLGEEEQDIRCLEDRSRGPAYEDTINQDRIPPNVSFRVFNESYVETNILIENRTVYFDAWATRDNVDNIENLTFRWNFGDGSIPVEENGLYSISHAFRSFGFYDVGLQVTDKSGNMGTFGVTLGVFLDASARPDLEILGWTFETSETILEEGREARISVNISNKEYHADATGIEVRFFVVNDEEVEIGVGTLRFYDEDGEEVQDEPLRAEEEWKAEIKWTPQWTGRLTIRVTVRAENETSLQIGSDNSRIWFVTVRESPANWVFISAALAIVLVFISVTVALVLRRQWSSK